MSTPKGAVYRVVQPQRVRDQFQELYESARARGFGPAVLSAARRIIARLRLDPGEFGEPRFVLHHANLEVRVLIVAPLVVGYAVHHERRVVFIREFSMLTIPEQ